MLDGLGRPWSGASWIGVERLYRIMMGAGWEGPWSPARSRPSTKGGLCFVGRDNESRVIYPERLGQ